MMQHGALQLLTSALWYMTFIFAFTFRGEASMYSKLFQQKSRVNTFFNKRLIAPSYNCVLEIVLI